MTAPMINPQRLRQVQKDAAPFSGVNRFSQLLIIGCAVRSVPEFWEDAVRPVHGGGAIRDGTVAARNRSQPSGTLLAIAIFKFGKGALLLALACGAMRSLHKDVAAQAQGWLDQLRVDPGNRFIGTLLSKLQLVHTKELKELSVLGAGYAALFLTEGTGLLFRQRWAEWLTIVSTSLFMPLEVYELIKRFTGVRLLLLLVNAGVVLFLVLRVRQKKETDRG